MYKTEPEALPNFRYLDKVKILGGFFHGQSGRVLSYLEGNEEKKIPVAYGVVLEDNAGGYPAIPFEEIELAKVVVFDETDQSAD